MHSGLLPAKGMVVYNLYVCAVSSIHIHAASCALLSLIYLPQFLIYLVCVYHVHLCLSAAVLHVNCFFVNCF